MSNDGRIESAHAAQYCVCAWCWGIVVERFDEESHRWIAECATYGSMHSGFHHFGYVEAARQQSTVDSAVISDGYRRSPYAMEFGLKPPLSAQELARYRRVLHGDGTGID